MSRLSSCVCRSVGPSDMCAGQAASDSYIISAVCMTWRDVVCCRQVLPVSTLCCCAVASSLFWRQVAVGHPKWAAEIYLCRSEWLGVGRVYTVIVSRTSSTDNRWTAHWRWFSKASSDVCLSSEWLIQNTVASDLIWYWTIFCWLW